MLLGLSEPTGGEAEVVGLDPARFPLEVKRRVGYLPDNVGFYATLTGRENLRYTARLNGLEREEGEARIDALLQQAGLGEAADSRVDTYSRGMRQRLGIADTLIKDPDVVILDEPTVAIDPEGVAEVLALIRSLARDRGVTLLLASHLLHQVQSVCDRVGIFVAGRMVAQGPMNELAERLAEGPVTVEVGVEGDDADIERALRSVPGVEQVERDERDRRLWRVRAERDVRDAIARALVSGGFSLRQLRRSGDELDEIYRRYFQEGEAGDGRVR
jgi:ABC-2 type transport system ATP-binding protein